MVEWWTDVPGKPGWYWIDTDTPTNVLEKQTKRDAGAKHYDLSFRVKESRSVADKFIITQPTAGEMYTVYNGHRNNLKARAREHFQGNRGTGCLALKQYNDLWKYKWSFYFVSIDEVGLAQDHRLVRIMVEQAWRVQYGWPVLCRG